LALALLGWIGLSTVAAAAAAAQERVPQAFLPAASDWRYLPADPAVALPDELAWRQPDFDDSAWETGRAPFGYGRAPPYGTDLSCRARPMRDNYSGLLLRRSFHVVDPSRVAELVPTLLFDDGFVMWINGTEVLRYNAPGLAGDRIPFTAVASGAHSPSRSRKLELPAPGEFLVAGVNVVAVHVLNRAVDNNDLRFDVEIRDPSGPDVQPPGLLEITPPAGTTLPALSTLDIVFDEVVLGLEASDLLLDGVPAVSVTGAGRGPYRFLFSAVTPGETRVEWAPDHGITDDSPEQYTFVGLPWSYRVDPDAAPTRVVLNEILPLNRTGLRDEDRDEEGWIELLNNGTETVNLLGWSLTDDLDEPEKWVFPWTLLKPGEFLVVFASGKDRSEFGAELHTNFKLDPDGEYLGLYRSSSRARISELVAALPAGGRRRFPEAVPDVAFGVSAAGEPAYLAPPTPGDSNDTATALAAVSAKPVLDVPHGFVTAPFALAIHTATVEAEIYVTTDGTEPSAENGILYAEPLQISQTTVVRAAAVKSGHVRSAVATRTYLFLDDVIRQSRMRQLVVDDPAYSGSIRDALRSVPTLSIALDPEDVFEEIDHPGSVELIHGDGAEGFQIDCALEKQGNASGKAGLLLKFKREFGPARLDYPFFATAPLHADSAATRFDRLILRAGNQVRWPGGAFRTQATYVEDEWVRASQVEMSGIGSRGYYAHLYINGVYWGLYNPVERPDAWFTSSYLGGEKEDYLALIAPGGVFAKRLSGATERLDRLVELATEKGLASPENYREFEELVDVDRFMDYVMLYWFGGVSDGVNANWYAGLRNEPPGKFGFFMWDAENSFLPPRTTPPGNISAWVPPFFFDVSPEAPLMLRLWTALLDAEDFSLRFADRVYKHCFGEGALSDGRSRERLRILTDSIADAMIGESARWGSGLTRDDDWRAAVAALDAKMDGNVDVFIAALRAWSDPHWPGLRLYPEFDPPLFRAQGGEVVLGSEVFLELAPGSRGSVYFTTDGSDPRRAGGSVSPTAAEFVAPFAVLANTTVRARTLGTTAAGDLAWSALTEATFRVAPASAAGLVIREIHYNPGERGEQEFLELHNPQDHALDLAGVHFTSGIGYTFGAGRGLAAGGRSVLAASETAFREHYGDVPLDGVYVGRLNNAGERLTLADSGGEVLFSVAYDDEGFWPLAPDGFGYSLVLDASAAVEGIDAGGVLGDFSDFRAWRSSVVRGGSPGSAEVEPAPDAVYISEVRARSGAATLGPPGGAIELWNSTETTVDIGGWFLSPSRQGAAGLREYILPPGTQLESGGYLVLREHEFNSMPGARGSFQLTRTGGELFLASTDASGLPGRHISGVSYGAAEAGTTFGRYSLSTGLAFPALRSDSLGKTNGPPRLPEVALNEIHYHPPNGASEFLELHNPGRGPVPLIGWQIEGILNPDGSGPFTFSEDVILEPEGFLLLVNSDPEVFRGLENTPEAVPILGPYGGGLRNSGERLELKKPFTGSAGVFEIVDSVRYDDRAPWPVEADGDGVTLERVDANTLGEEVLHWGASQWVGGTPGALNSVTPERVEGWQLPGDFDQDARLTLIDGLHLLEYLFLDPFVGEAAALLCEDLEATKALLDVDGNEAVALGDALHLFNHLFARGPGHVLGNACMRVPGCQNVCR